MRFFELTITVLVKKDLHFQKAQEALGAYLNRSMLQDENLKQLHARKGSKLYVYSSLYPVETRTKVYKAGAVYVFRVRSLMKKFTNWLEPCLRTQRDLLFQCIAIEKRTCGNRMIQELYSVTPFVVTVNNQPWLQETDDLDLLISRLEANADKKYQDAFEEKLVHSRFIQRLEFVNQKPIAMSYKGIRLLGNKLRITVNSDDPSQKLAYTVLGAGLGEKGSTLGAGFCFANYV